MHEKINYVEFAASDLAATQQFFERAFGWSFEAYGSEYIAFSQSGVDGGFFRADRVSTPEQGAPLVVLFSEALEKTQTQIEACGGVITQAIFHFPGGRRFHFREPSGNELAVWSTQEAAE